MVTLIDKIKSYAPEITIGSGTFVGTLGYRLSDAVTQFNTSTTDILQNSNGFLPAYTTEASGLAAIAIGLTYLAHKAINHYCEK